MRRLGAVAAAVAIVGCVNEPSGPDPPAAPRIDAAQVGPGPHNVLSAVVSVRTRQADSVIVFFRPTDTPAGGESTTPPVPLTADTALVPVLGLVAGRDYLLRIVAYGPGGVVQGNWLPFTTGALPADLPQYVASGTDPSPGYVVFAAASYGLVIDNTGRVVWYRHFPHGPGLNFMAQPNGRYVARPATPDPLDVEPWYELDALGHVTRTLNCAGLPSRFHDLILETAGSYWIMCDETRTMDLSAVGGVTAARVTGTVVQRIGATGTLLFQWSPFDHFEITDLEAADRATATVNWTHGNSIELDATGALLVSFRSLNEITKIDPASGAVLWRMGGRRNQFQFLGSSMPAFSRQHGVRAYAAGSLVLLDNVGDPAESRAEHYVLDEATRTVTLTRSYGSDPAVVTQIGGSVQPVSVGRTLVSFGTAGRVEEYDATGRVVWRIQGNAGYVFRAQRIRSLYAPGAGTAR